jgi:hypothetical protein
MSGLTVDILDMNSDSVHDEVDLILNSSGPDIMELIASDPAYYLNIVANYTKTRDGRDVYLPDLCNILITKREGEYRIKFKLTDNGQWYEVGYCGTSFTEDDVHQAFSKKVAYALTRPVDEHRKMISNCLQETGATTPNDVSADVQPGSVHTYSKIDKFMKRAKPKEGFVSSDESPVSETPVPELPEWLKPVSCKKSSSEPLPDIKGPMFKEDASCPAPANSVDTVSREVPPKVTDDQREMPEWLKPMSCKPTPDLPQKGLTLLDSLKVICPQEHLYEYARMVTLLRSEDTFTQGLIEALPLLTGGQQIVVMKFLTQVI